MTTYTSRKNELRAVCTRAGLFMDTYSPGDGVTRYRFMLKDMDYFATDGIYTALGRAEALTFARGFLEGRSAPGEDR